METTFSAANRKFREVLREKKFHNQVKEIKLKLIVYDVNKNMVEIIYIKLRISTEPFFFLSIFEIISQLKKNPIHF